MINKSALAVLLTIPILYVVYLDSKRRRTRRYLPPGPKPSWLWGNAIPKTNSPRTYEAWSRQFGPLYTLQKGFGEHIVIIGDHETAMDIMEKEGASLADRPRNVAAGEIVSGDMRTLILRQSAKLNRFRKALHAALQPRSLSAYIPIQEANARTVIKSILSSPENHIKHADTYAANTIIAITYGHSSLRLHDHGQGTSFGAVVKRVRKCLDHFLTAGAPGAFLVEKIPMLKACPSWAYPPGQTLQKWHAEELGLFKGMVDGVRTAREVDANGSPLGVYKEGYEDAATSFTAYILDKQPEMGISDDELAYLAGSMFGAGSDTTSGVISFTIMAAALFPDMQARVQEQIDKVVGRERPPNATDEPLLPYVVAFYQEVYRLWPVSVGGVQHRVTKVIHYKGYIIPEGTTVFMNNWAVGRCSAAFQNPDPEQLDIFRWLVPSSPNSEEMVLRNDIKTWSFGFGRRICPGMHFANRSVFLNTALLLWAFCITQDPDPRKKIDKEAVTPFANMRPLPFSVRFEPRGDAAELRRMLG